MDDNVGRYGCPDCHGEGLDDGRCTAPGGSVIDEKTLENFISRKYHWHSLMPHQQREVAIELKRLRLINDALYKVLEEVLGKEKTDEIKALIG